MPATTVKSEATDQHNDCDNEEEEPKDMKNAHLIIGELRNRCRNQSEQIMAWKKAYSLQQEQNHRLQKEKAEQLNYLTSQLLLLESRIMRKQKQVSNVIYQREITIYRQQKIIEALSSRLIDHGIMDVGMEPPMHCGSNSNDFDSLNDSDSAVVLEDVDSDCNSSIYFGGSISGSLKSRCGSNKMSNDVTIVRSISDAIETNLKYNNTRRSNCFLRRPEILETVYSVEEDPEPQNNAQTSTATGTTQTPTAMGQSGSGTASGSTTGPTSPKPEGVSEKRDKFRNRTEKCISTDQPQESAGTAPVIITSSSCDVDSDSCDVTVSPMQHQQDRCKTQGAVTNFNRVMSNHRSVTKPKDVKYKRINKAKSKSLEELRGRLKHWVERGTCNINLSHDPSNGTGVVVGHHLPEHCGAGAQLQQTQPQPQASLAQSYA
ncbi:uncharacterized protein LOC125949931 [Anopheles darlingi]|uniref:uncharacterized protein LOC125949931 n=1 Tax=Anopheles darlingi TaxID=43151 RepID=UPI0021003A54|nr:uncharacterized protein LOC125949931 [Anopheles darlingi]XP_049533387.1 uncharacterized protein LOC125949931 [Anopheles darlingi]XP_049533388.1 uncharacterized protein LOC125949931 [Anopheles darlingi]XP_049533389.1 uncharacterized protein LOC125949931 [Anopheles darlingi]XP_049533390.1 uncharacterized protein LOC125949931 [Anopheles darlingi]